MNIKGRVQALEKKFYLPNGKELEVIVIGWQGAEMDSEYTPQELEEIEAAKRAGCERVFLWRD